MRGQPSAVRNIFVKDNTDELEVALWRGNAETTATLHAWVQITNVVNEANSYHPLTFLATTQNTTISISSTLGILFNYRNNKTANDSSTSVQKTPKNVSKGHYFANYFLSLRFLFYYQHCIASNYIQ